MRPQVWATIAIPEFQPETWPDLPGYNDRREPEKPPKRTSTPHVKRSKESLTEERDKLLAQRDGLGATYLPDDPGALSGIRRRRGAADYRQDSKTDADLERFAALTKRIDYLEHRLLKEGP